MSRMNPVAAVGLFCIALVAVHGAGKSRPTMAMYQRFYQSSGRFSVVDQVKLHPDGSYDQTKQTSEMPKIDDFNEQRKPSKTDDDDTPRGNPPKDAGAGAWKNPYEYWRTHGRKSAAPPAVSDDTDASPKKCAGTWRLLSKSGGVIPSLPKSVMDVPEGAVIELDRAIPLGPVSKVWKNIDITIPAKEFDYYHSY